MCTLGDETHITISLSLRLKVLHNSKEILSRRRLPVPSRVVVVVVVPPLRQSPMVANPGREMEMP